MTAEVSDALRARVREELPEVEEIGDAELREKVVEAWALALARSSFGSIGEIEPSGNPGQNTLKKGVQGDHIRGVTRLAMRIAEEMSALFRDLEVDRDILIAGALCRDGSAPGSTAPDGLTRYRSYAAAQPEFGDRTPCSGLAAPTTAMPRSRSVRAKVGGALMVSFAIIRASNGRRHEVDFEDAEITVDIAIGTKAVQVTIEAVHDQAPSHKRRFATLSLPREAFAAALGADLRERHGRGLPGGLSPVPEEG